MGPGEEIAPLEARIRRPRLRRATSRRRQEAHDRGTRVAVGAFYGSMTRKTELERAFDLARSGRISSCNEIRLTLRREGYNPDQIQGAALLRQLRDLIADAQRERFGGGAATTASPRT